MATCLESQVIYCSRSEVRALTRLQILAAIFFLLVLGAQIWVKVETTHRGYQLAKLHEASSSLEMRKRELKLAREILMRPDLLQEKAGQLGLKPLEVAQIRRIP